MTQNIQIVTSMQKNWGENQKQVLKYFNRKSKGKLQRC